MPMLVLDVLVNFLSDPQSSRHEECPYITSVVLISLKFITNSSSLQCSGKRAVVLLSDSKSESWEKK